MVIRAFEVERVSVRYPFTVKLASGINEQIDGIVYAPFIAAMAESKDQDGVDVGPLAKLRGQLMRRPSGTIGLALCSGSFTLPAVALAGEYAPCTVLLLTGWLARLDLSPLSEVTFVRELRDSIGVPDVV